MDRRRTISGKMRGRETKDLMRDEGADDEVSQVKESMRGHTGTGWNTSDEKEDGRRYGRCPPVVDKYKGRHPLPSGISLSSPHPHTAISHINTPPTTTMKTTIVLAAVAGLLTGIEAGC
jgi:hypothetical protein